MAHAKPRLAVIYDGAAGPKVYRIAVAIAARAWDAGSGVRVRRLGELVVPDGSASHPDWLNMLNESADVPEAGAADLAWANVALVVRHPDDSTLCSQSLVMMNNGAPSNS
jgi:hypothetical protein